MSKTKAAKHLTCWRCGQRRSPLKQVTAKLWLCTECRSEKK